ncbi:hypothetical protein BH24DEI2_BH24DEI2_22770 [soil metagenome]
MTGRTPTVFRALDYLESRPRYVTLMVSLVLIGFLGLVDYWTGPELSVAVFYLLPIVMTAWLVGGRWAMIVSAAGMLCWVWADFADGNTYTHPLIPYWNAALRFVYFVIVSYLTAFIRSLLEREHTLSRTDPLTGALNKLGLNEFAESELNRVKRYPHPLSIAYIDLANFKQVNDRLGHGVGDELLRQVVATLQHVMRSTDKVARLGGDEFAVLMIETGSEDARKAFSKAQASLLAKMRERNWPVTFSIGIVTFLEPPGSVADLLSAADALMYRVKHKGKNRVAYGVVPARPRASDLRPTT